MTPSRVSVIVPARQCAPLLAECLDRIAQQTVPALEVIIAVGPSSDGTREVANAIADRMVHVRVIDNPRGDRASALNAAIAEAAGDVVAFVDAQSLLDPAYLELALVVMRETGAAIVGGPMRPRGRGAFGRAVARALVSPFGIGDSAFHFAGAARDVDSVYLGVYRRDVFETIGQYDESLLRTEDDDFNARARGAGFRVRLDSRIRSTYLCRDSVADLWRQYHDYGYWKVPLVVARPSSFRVRHLVPAAAVGGALLFGLGSVSTKRPLLPVGIAGYAAAAAAFDLKLGGPRSLVDRMLFPVATATMHVAYGVGSLKAAFHFRRALAAALARRDA